MRFLSANGFLPVCDCKNTTFILIGEFFFSLNKKNALQNTVRRADKRVMFSNHSLFIKSLADISKKMPRMHGKNMHNGE